VDVEFHIFLTSALDGGEWSTSRPGRFIPRETAFCTDWIGDCVGPRVGLDTVVKRKIPSPFRDLNHDQPVRSPAINWAISVLSDWSSRTFDAKNDVLFT